MNRLSVQVCMSVGVACLILSGCSSEDTSGRKATFPVTGKVLVDGQPAKMLRVDLYSPQDPDKSETHSSGFTDDTGTFTLSTYDQGDGAPEGEYVATFIWGEMNLISMEYGKDDKLKGRYNDPKTATHKFKVEAGKSNDLGTIELTTK